MSPQGIKDRIAIIGMSCTKFAEHFDKGLDDLLKEAALKACRSAQVELSDIEAYWFGTAQSAMSGIALARAIGIGDKPITRVENFCATGSEALRNASYAVASGAYDIAMAIGGEKVKDSGSQEVRGFESHRLHPKVPGQVVFGLGLFCPPTLNVSNDVSNAGELPMNKDGR
jgi:acetyl-CoA C-acetyltransferase